MSFGRTGLGNGMRLAIIASQVPFVIAAIDSGGWLEVAGIIGAVLYASLVIFICYFAVKDHGATVLAGRRGRRW